MDIIWLQLAQRPCKDKVDNHKQTKQNKTSAYLVAYIVYDAWTLLENYLVCNLWIKRSVVIVWMDNWRTGWDNEHYLLGGPSDKLINCDIFFFKVKWRDDGLSIQKCISFLLVSTWQRVLVGHLPKCGSLRLPKVTIHIYRKSQFTYVLRKITTYLARMRCKQPFIGLGCNKGMAEGRLVAGLCYVICREIGHHNTEQNKWVDDEMLTVAMRHPRHLPRNRCPYNTYDK